MSDWNFTGVEAYVFVCECGDRFVGGREDVDPGTRNWFGSHRLSRAHRAWEAGRARERCTHAGKSSIIEVGGTDRWYRRCDECWRYLYATDANGNAVQSESL